jgi:DHA1 family tetracycline resistance protein-like MFS transporter
MHLSQLKGMGALLGIVAFTSLAQFILQGTWVLYTQHKFGWTPAQVGWSLCAVGAMSVLVQGVLVGRLVKLLSLRRLVVLGLASSAACYLAWGAATQGWMMFAIIFLNLLSATVSSAIQSIFSSAADARSQGKTMGAVSGLNSLTAVVAPLLAAPLLIMVSHLQQGDWRIGLPMYFCALLQGAALLLAVSHFRRERRLRRVGSA